jgi:hypothetical protein
MLHRLRAVLDELYKEQNREGEQDIQDDRAQLDPWDFEHTGLDPCYVTTSFNRKTHEGYWKEIDNEFTAIRIEQLKMLVPPYMGLRRTLQFHHQDGKKMDWIMLEYQQLDDIKPPALFLQVIGIIHLLTSKYSLRLESPCQKSTHVNIKIFFEIRISMSKKYPFLDRKQPVNQLLYL